MVTATSADIQAAREHLNQHGYAVIPNLVDRGTIADLKAGWSRLLAHERNIPSIPAMGRPFPAMTAIAANMAPSSPTRRSLSV